MNKRLMALALVALVLMGLSGAAWALRSNQVYAGSGGLRVGSAANNWSKFTVNGSSGAMTAAGTMAATPTTTTGNAWTFTGTTLTTGNLLKLTGVDATINGGKYLNIYGGTGSTSVWSVGEGGVTTITPTTAAAAVDTLSLNCILNSTGDLIQLKADDDVLAGGLYINALGGSAADTAVWTLGEGGAVVGTPVRSAAAYAYGWRIDSDDDFFTGGAATKSRLLSIEGERPAGSAATGDSNDAGVFVSVNNYAANDTNFVFRALNAGVNNRSGGVLGLIENNLSASGKSGGTVNNIVGLSITAENYGTVSDRFGGLDVLLKNEGAVATTEYGIRIRNEENSIGDAVAAAISVTDTGANTGFDYILDANGASSAVVADIRLTNGETISNATDGEIAFTGTLTAPAVTPVSDATASRVCTSADYGKVIILSQAGAVAVTLPANGAAAGSWIDFMILSADATAPTISAATADTMVGPNSIGLDSVTWGSGQRIGAYARFISDGSFWHVLNLGPTTMTFTE